MVTSRARRTRKIIEITLSPDARAALERLASEHPDRTRSAVVEELVIDADRAADLASLGR